MRLTLNSFKDDTKLHTGFYSDKAYSMFREIIRNANNNFSFCKQFYVFRNNLSETIICSNCGLGYYARLNLDSQNLSHQIGIKAIIAKYTPNADDYCIEIQRWTSGKQPLDAEKFNELVGTPANPIEAAMKDVLSREETKVNEKFESFRDELSRRNFKSTNVIFAENIRYISGHCGYNQSVSSASYLTQEKVNELLAAEDKAREALQALINAATAYESAQIKWHKVNKETKHLLIEAKNKEITSLRKQVQKAMNSKKSAC